MPLDVLLKSVLAGVALAITLAGCSGGGGSRALTYPDPTQTPAAVAPKVNYNTAEYRQNYGLDTINAIAAYDAGLSGAGVTVAVVDTGIDRTHPDLIANIDAASTNVATGNPADVQDADTKNGHGTAVSGIIAAERNGVGMHGVAFNARLLAVSAVDPAQCTPSDCSLNQSAIAAGIDYARLHGAKVVNLSLGGDPAGSTLTDALMRAVSAGMIVTIAAGNDSDSAPSALASVAGEPWADGQIIIVGATDNADAIANFSDKAGNSLKALFVVAPGVDIVTTGRGGGYVIGSGTSFSAPHAAGAAALLFENFPNLTAHDVANILLTTARDLGDPGVDAVFGQGLIDIAAAIQPIGPVGLAVNDLSLGAPSSDLPALTASGMVLSPAFGDALDHVPALVSVMGLDSYRRSYRISLGGRILTTPTTPDLAAIADGRHQSGYQNLIVRKGLTLEAAYRWDARLADRNRAEFDRSAPGEWERPEMTARLAYALDGQTTLTAAYHQGDQGPGRAGLLFDSVNNSPFNTVAREGTVFGLRWTPGRRLGLVTTFGTARLPATVFNTEAARTTALDTRLSYGVSKHLVVTARAGVVDEQGSVLGARSSGGLRLVDGARTVRGGLGLAWNAGPVQAYLEGDLARTTADNAAASLVRGLSGLWASHFAAGVTAANVFGPGDRLGFEVTQPLRIEGGSALVRAVTGRDYQRNRLIYDDVATPLTPSGREIDLGLGYRMAPGPLSNLRLQFLHQFDAGHRTGVSATVLLLGFAQRF